MRLSLNILVLILWTISWSIGCGDGLGSVRVEREALPYLGPKKDSTLLVNGTIKDTFFYHSIPKFTLINQLGDTITSQDIQHKAYIAEFFFTSCPSVCPKVAEQLNRVYHRFEQDSNFMILSHTIDPKRDDPERLKNYAIKLGVKSEKWLFLTGNRDDIYDLANYGYQVVVYEDQERKKNNILHDGTLVLVDRNRHIRGMYDGTDPEDADRLMRDVARLLSPPKWGIE